MAIFKKTPSDAGWLVVGLGNPGRQYELTRHNMGFRAIDKIAEKNHFNINKMKFSGMYERKNIFGQTVVFLKPCTFMNNSGESVAAAASFFKIPVEHIIIMFDDISLPVGRLRVRANGSAGGHNGIKSIIAHLGSDAFPRVKIGVGAKPHPEYDLADWVLSEIAEADLPAADRAIANACGAVELIITNGVEAAASKFNGAS